MAEEDVEIQRSVELSHYLYVLRRRWWVIMCGALLGLLLASAYLIVTPKSVTATALVNVNAFSSEPFNNAKPESQLIDPETESELARSSEVLGQVARTMGAGYSLAKVKGNTSVKTVANATVIQISFTGPSEPAADKAADTIARRYLEYRGQTAAAKITSITDRLVKQRDQLRKSLLAANREAAKAQKGSVAAIQAESDRQMINLELNALLSQLNQIGSVDTNGGTLISSAEDNAIQVSPDRRMALATGGLAGLILGLVSAFVVAALDKRVFTSRELPAAGGGDVLSECNASSANLPAVGADLDDIRSLRERLLVPLNAGSVLVVADLTRHAQPSDVGANLAASMAEGKRSVRLVLPEYSASFESDLKDLLMLEHVETTPEASTYASQHVPGLTVVFAPGDAQTARASASSLASILRTRPEDYLVTVVSLPPTATRSLRLAAGRLGHSTILVANRRGTKTPDIQRLASDLDAVSGVIHGSVIVPRSRSLVKPAHAHEDQCSGLSSESAVRSTRAQSEADEPASRSSRIAGVSEVDRASDTPGSRFADDQGEELSKSRIDDESDEVATFA